MSPALITILFLAFAIVMFVTEKIPLGVTSMIVCTGLVVTNVLDVSTAFKGFINSNVILFVAMFIVGGALFETGMANEIGGLVTRFAKTEKQLIVAIMVIVGLMSGVPQWKKTLSLVILIGTLLGMIFEDQIGIKLCITGCIGALLLILTGVISENNALKAIDLKTIFLFGGTLSLAEALDKTGAGEMIANAVIGALGANPSPYILTFVVFILCCIMTNFMSNTATTALMAPICLSIAQGMGADPRAVLMACVIGGSCAYATPIGMPANTMVVGAGGYRFNDYVKSGLPLIVIATIVSMIILPIAFPFFPA
ncbi:MAG: SLC13/DASS family transporter [Lachnospiraceae bacterium]|nr:SLC13/DASS family transporter [Lachnospiraceae bacterium]